MSKSKSQSKGNLRTVEDIIGKFTLRETENIRELSVRNKNLNSSLLLECLCKLKYLTTLDASHNAIKLWPNGGDAKMIDSSKFPLLKYLDSAEEIDWNSRRLLTHLYLSNNLFTSTSSLANSCLLHLRVLDLSSNQLSTTSVGLIPLIHLESLNLSNNRISIVEGLETLSKLTQLNLSKNLIKNVTDLHVLQFNKSLKDIDIRENPVSNAKKMVLMGKYAAYRVVLVQILPCLTTLNGSSVAESTPVTVCKSVVCPDSKNTSSGGVASKSVTCYEHVPHLNTPSPATTRIHGSYKEIFELQMREGASEPSEVQNHCIERNGLHLISTSAIDVSATVEPALRCVQNGGKSSENKENCKNNFDSTTSRGYFYASDALNFKEKARSRSNERTKNRDAPKVTVRSRTPTTNRRTVQLSDDSPIPWRNPPKLVPRNWDSASQKIVCSVSSCTSGTSSTRSPSIEQRGTKPAASDVVTVNNSNTPRSPSGVRVRPCVTHSPDKTPLICYDEAAFPISVFVTPKRRSPPMQLNDLAVTGGGSPGKSVPPQSPVFRPSLSHGQTLSVSSPCRQVSANKSCTTDKKEDKELVKQKQKIQPKLTLKPKSNAMLHAIASSYGSEVNTVICNMNNCIDGQSNKNAHQIMSFDDFQLVDDEMDWMCRVARLSVPTPVSDARNIPQNVEEFATPVDSRAYLQPTYSSSMTAEQGNSTPAMYSADPPCNYLMPSSISPYQSPLFSKKTISVDRSSTCEKINLKVHEFNHMEIEPWHLKEWVSAKLKEVRAAEPDVEACFNKKPGRLALTCDNSMME